MEDKLKAKFSAKGRAKRPRATPKESADLRFCALATGTGRAPLGAGAKASAMHGVLVKASWGSSDGT